MIINRRQHAGLQLASTWARDWRITWHDRWLPAIGHRRHHYQPYIIGEKTCKTEMRRCTEAQANTDFTLIHALIHWNTSLFLLIFILLSECRREFAQCRHESSRLQFRSTRCLCCEGHQRIHCTPEKTINTDYHHEKGRHEMEVNVAIYFRFHLVHFTATNNSH